MYDAVVKLLEFTGLYPVRTLAACFSRSLPPFLRLRGYPICFPSKWDSSFLGARNQESITLRSGIDGRESGLKRSGNLGIRGPIGRGGLAPNLGSRPIHRERAPKIKLSLLESPKLFVASLFYTGLKGYWNIAINSNW